VNSHRRVSLRRAAATAAAVLMAGTAVLLGAGPAGAHAGDDCRAYGPTTAHPWVKIVAQDNAFDTDCLMAPADRGFRIYLQNRDRDTAHNLSIYSADPAKDKKANQLFKGPSVKGQTQEEYSVDALPGGTYWFQDDKTTSMHGTVQVPKSKK
jgi:hypothetical protein